ncbi:ATPase involved in archaellum/pili biosynthesis [Halalkaliarchaeum sp. AArc-CO]|nr:ATPase involved in archaellum/pili biosynthesis [Halalkaliarchaeum sp. AArc-CO]
MRTVGTLFEGGGLDKTMTDEDADGPEAGESTGEEGVESSPLETDADADGSTSSEGGSEGGDLEGGDTESDVEDETLPEPAESGTELAGDSEERSKALEGPGDGAEGPIGETDVGRTDDEDNTRETPELEGETAVSPEGESADREADAVRDEEPGRQDEEPEPPEYTAVVGEYTWDDFLREHGYEEAAEALYARFDTAPGSERWGDGEVDRSLEERDWERAGVDPAEFLGFHPDELLWRLGAADSVGSRLRELAAEIHDLSKTPPIKGYYTWEDYKKEFFYDEEGNPPTDEEGNPLAFDRTEALGFDPEGTENVLSAGKETAERLLDLEDERTVDVQEELDENEFFGTTEGNTTLVNRYDLEKAVPIEKKTHFREVERYWVNKPYSFVIIFHSRKENEKKYYAVQPHLNEIESRIQEYLTDKIRTSIKYSDENVAGAGEGERRDVIKSEAYQLLDRYDLYERENEPLGNKLQGTLGLEHEGWIGGLLDAIGYEEPTSDVEHLAGLSARPERAVIEDDPETLTEYQVEKLLYYLIRDFIGYERIDPIKHDINVEDISCDGYNSPVFVYHSDYEQIISNVYHGETELDDFVVKLAQRSGKGISKRSPQVDATLPDGSRAQLTLGKEVSDHGTNYTIRQFKDVPFTPIDLINWNTFALDQMAFLWLCIENHKSLIFAGGTASGKTTSLNAVSLFIPSNAKIVSIEDTREVELPQRNWIASVTRPSFTADDKGDVDEFDLLEAALRQRPDYIVMGEIRGEEGRTLFQVMSTGHTTYTTFHADNVGEVLKRFTTDPINVSKTMFTALDLVSVQSSTRVRGNKVRRNKSLTEINHYDPENDEINVQDVFQWQAETDEFLKMGASNTLEEIKFDRGWKQERLEEELFKRRVVLAYLIVNGLNTYAQVAATLQAFINDPDTILALMANDGLEQSLEDLREMESVLIDVDPEKEEMVPRPDPDEEGLAEAKRILEEAEELFAEYRDVEPGDVADALFDVDGEATVEASAGEDRPALEAATEDADGEAADPSGPAEPPSPDGDTEGPPRITGDGEGIEASGELEGETTAEADGELDGTTVAGELDGDTANDPDDSFGTPAGSDDGDANLEGLFDDIDGGDEPADDVSFDDSADDVSLDDSADDVSFDDSADDVSLDDSADDVTFDEPSFDTGTDSEFDTESGFGSVDAGSSFDDGSSKQERSVGSDGTLDSDDTEDELDDWGFGSVNEDDSADGDGATDGGESPETREDG